MISDQQEPAIGYLTSQKVVTYMEYRIIGGSLKIDKHLFAKESLISGSSIRVIMGLEGKGSQKVKEITKNKETIEARYTIKDKVFLGENFLDLFKEMKEAYPGKIKGSIQIGIDTDYSFDDCSTTITFD